MSNYLCFDLGTTKIKSCLLDNNGNIIYFSSIDAKTYYDDGIYQKPEEYYNAIISEINIIKAKHPQTFKKAEVLICSGQMGGLLGIDENWDVVFPWTHSLDSRCNNHISRIEKSIGELIRKKSGGYPFGPGKMVWIKKDFPALYKRIKKFINLHSYISGKLCNIKSDKAFIDYSCLALFGLADVINNKWEKDICGHLEIDIEKLPKICKPFEIVGNIDKNFFGTENDISVMVGCGDQLAGFFGAGVIKNGDIVDVTGTYTVLGYCTSKFKSDMKNKVFSSFYSGIDNIFYQMATIAAGGYTYGWFIDKFNYKPWIKFEDYRDSKGLYFIPYLGGRYHPFQPYYDGSWLGITWGHTLDDFYVSLLEGFGYEFNFYLKFLKELNNLSKDDLKEIKVIGGGARDNFWSNIKANILNLKYIKLTKIPFEIMGLYLIAKYRDDLKYGFNKMVENKIIYIEDIILPQKDKVNLYEKNKNKYIKIINKLDKIYYNIKNYGVNPIP